MLRPQFEPGKTIPDDIIWQLLENANWAPSHKKSEPWRFTVFTGAGLQLLAAFQANLGRETAGPKFDEGKYAKLRALPPPCLLASGMRRVEQPRPEIEAVEAVAGAGQNRAIHGPRLRPRRFLEQRQRDVHRGGQGIFRPGARR